MAPPPRLARTQEFLIGRVPWLHSRTISNSRRRFVCGPVAARIVGKVRNLIESALHHLLACIWISCIFACDVKRNGTRWKKMARQPNPWAFQNPAYLSPIASDVFPLDLRSRPVALLPFRFSIAHWPYVP